CPPTLPLTPVHPHATATPALYTLSLHDALPICAARRRSASASRRPTPAPCSDSRGRSSPPSRRPARRRRRPPRRPGRRDSRRRRSEEHTSELQSRENLVCRLLLEKNNRNALKRE